MPKPSQVLVLQYWEKMARQKKLRRKRMRYIRRKTTDKKMKMETFEKMVNSSIRKLNCRKLFHGFVAYPCRFQRYTHENGWDDLREKFFKSRFTTYAIVYLRFLARNPRMLLQHVADKKGLEVRWNDLHKSTRFYSKKEPNIKSSCLKELNKCFRSRAFVNELAHSYETRFKAIFFVNAYNSTSFESGPPQNNPPEVMIDFTRIRKKRGKRTTPSTSPADGVVACKPGPINKQAEEIAALFRRIKNLKPQEDLKPQNVRRSTRIMRSRSQPFSSELSL